MFASRVNVEWSILSAVFSRSGWRSIGAIFAIGFASSAIAQTDAGVPDAEVPADELTPPRLVEFVEAAYPDAAAAEGLEATVELELTVDEFGAVTAATVPASAGYGFDEAAQAAALRFRFEPARRGDTPIASIITYRYVFELRPLQPEAPPRGDLSGQVLGGSDGAAIEGVEILITALADVTMVRREVTGADGRFQFSDLAPGEYHVHVLGNDRGEMQGVETVVADQVTDVVYRLDGGEDSSGYGLTALVERPPREITRRTIRREQLTRIPGTRGDALRAVEVLPGVARPPFGVGLFVVRGSAPGDSEVLLEGAPIPFLYHFGGLTSVFQSRMLEQIDFYPGNFSARYGRRMGGILEVGVRDPANDRVHSVTEFSLIDASTLVEFPIGERFSLAMGLRRSLIDLVFEYVVPEGTIDVLAAPVYWDYQLIGVWRPTARDHVRFTFYGSSDTFKLFLSDAVGDDPVIRGNTNLRTMFHFLQLTWDREVGDRVEQEIDLQVGPVIGEFGVGDALSFDGRFLQSRLRAEWRARLSPKVRLIGGLDVDFVPFEVDFTGPQIRQSEGGGFNGDPLSSDEVIHIQTSNIVVRPGVYLEGDFQLADPVQLVLGVRADYYGEIDEWSIDPRLTMICELTQGTRLKLGAGLFSQPPDVSETADREAGNPDLEPAHSVHVGIGIERDFTDGITLGIEGFYKHLWNRVIGTEQGVEPYFENGGIGRIFGMEVSGRFEVGDRFFGYLSYTLSRSRRRDQEDDGWRFFDFDQTHILNLAGVVDLGRGWEIGATLRLVSGNPFTPIAGAVYDARNGVYQPLNGSTNSERNPLFHRLDLRIEKEWTFDHFRLALFLDVQNIYNAENQEGIIYSFDFSQSTPISGLPIIPAIGLRGEL